MKTKVMEVGVSIIMAIGIIFMMQSFVTMDVASTTTLSNSNKKFVKTESQCAKSNCSCSGYWGYKHQNGTYEGACYNTDGYGHTCGHGPEKHGLKKMVKGINNRLKIINKEYILRGEYASEITNPHINYYYE